jgi:hypothetical protein
MLYKQHTKNNPHSLLTGARRADHEPAVGRPPLLADLALFLVR